MPARLRLALALFAIFTMRPAAAADAALIAAAQKEGKAVWYTTLIVDQFVRPLTEAFEKKYGIKVDYIRADMTEVGLRVLNEGRAGKMLADVFDGFSQVTSLDKEGFVEHWLPDAAKRFPKALYDPDGRWVASNLYVLTPGFNTDLVPKGSEPKTFEDLLDPKLKGRIVWSSNVSPSGAAGFIGLVLLHMGDEKGMDYLRRFAKQNVTGVKLAARAVLDQVIAGEYAVALQIFNNHPGISAAKGAPVDWIRLQPSLAALAPVDWIRLQPSLAALSAVSITKPAPHPNAARLLVDFLISPEGQEIYRKADYMPVDPQIAPRDPRLRPDGVDYKAIYLTPDQIDGALPKWAKIYDDLFR
jgi:iron(III) transport system substrate-binding protein